MSLSPTYTIVGSPYIPPEDDPNTTAPAAVRKFYPPALSVGPSQLWMYRKDGTGSLVMTLWYHDPINGCWVQLCNANNDYPKQMGYFKVDLGVTAELFVQAVYVGGGDITKVAYGFGIGSLSV